MTLWQLQIWLFLSLSGSGVLVLTTTEVDKTGASYYGEQGLHYLSAKGEGNMVLLGEKRQASHMVLYREGGHGIPSILCIRYKHVYVGGT